MPRQDREKRFIAEYMVQNFPPGTFALNVPVGPIPRELIQMHGLTQAAALFRPSRRRVDATAWSPDAYYVIEAKIRDPFEGLGRLLIYAFEAVDSLDMPGFEGQPIIPRLVVPFVIERDRLASVRFDIEMVEFRPAWIADYLRERQLYHTASFRAARDDRKQTLKLLGLDE